ncbi:hypothetical protein LDENG_00022780 [Lucifuga dentata]|nr:hypothetical protein LDENG_00022780 [Lucifuga dentata]
MDDYEYSVQISDQDWECFFAECEECIMLPPSLAGMDDAGMSNIDDTGSILADRVLKVGSTVEFMEANLSIDGPPDCEGSPVELYLSKQSLGSIENVLSDSEEDIHLQSVNMFFERLKSLTETEKLIEPSQVKAGENRKAAEEEELCSDGQQASNSSNALPKNIPKLNSLLARSKTAIDKETTETVNTTNNRYTMKKDEPDSKICTGPSAENSLLKTNKSAHPETGSFIRQEFCPEIAVNEERQQKSDDEEDHGPVRVVTRFSHKSDKSQISTDDYENFFTDSDLRQNLFWKTTFSFRNTHFMRSPILKQSSNPLSLQPVRQSSRSPQWTIPAISAQGNELFQEPLLLHLEDRISRPPAQQRFNYEDLQAAVSNPRLDASLLPFRQSDLCLVCIAFSSWVLKSANSQVGDTWKAALLANVSALSAIRYLRQYIRVETLASEKELHHTAPDS